jgi:hypothetical protein
MCFCCGPPFVGSTVTALAGTGNRKLQREAAWPYWRVAHEWLARPPTQAVSHRTRRCTFPVPRGMHGGLPNARFRYGRREGVGSAVVRRSGGIVFSTDARRPLECATGYPAEHALCPQRSTATRVGDATCEACSARRFLECRTTVEQCCPPAQECPQSVHDFPHSFRNARMGSMEAARIAGRQAAVSPASATTAQTPARTRGLREAAP